jgi:hypothetical protein
MKKSMLQNALNDISAFSDVRTSEQMDIAKGNGPIVYKNHVTLIHNVAGTYDKANATVINRRRTVNSHHFYDNDTDIIPYDVDDLDFGSMSLYDINQHHRAGNNAGRPKLKYNIWKALSQDDQSLRDQLTDEAKSVIIRNHNADARQPGNTAANPTFQPTRRLRHLLIVISLMRFKRLVMTYLSPHCLSMQQLKVPAYAQVTFTMSYHLLRPRNIIRDMYEFKHKKQVSMN